MTTKQETKKYYKLESIESNLKSALRETREEPGFSLKDIARVIKKVLAKEEVKSLKENL
jgi:hypothetical protein